MRANPLSILSLMIFVLFQIGCDFRGKSISELNFFSKNPNKKLPSEIPGLVHWLDSNQGISFDPQNRVIEWRDISKHNSGLNYSLISSVENTRPSYTPINTSLNSYPTVDFSNDTHELNFRGPDTASIFSSTNVTFGMVFIPTQTRITIGYEIGWNQNPTYSPFFSLGQNQSHLLSGFTRQSQSPNHHQTQAKNYQLQTPVIFIAEFTHQGSSINYVNGESGTLDNQSIYDINPVALGQISLFRLGGGDFQGKIAETFFYQRRINNSERRELECHLFLKYRIKNQCPS